MTYRDVVVYENPNKFGSNSFNWSTLDQNIANSTLCKMKI